MYGVECKTKGVSHYGIVKPLETLGIPEIRAFSQLPPWKWALLLGYWPTRLTLAHYKGLKSWVAICCTSPRALKRWILLLHQKALG